MTFPVLGQIAGLLIVLAITYVYSINLTWLLKNFPIFDNINFLILFSILITLPGLFLFTKAFWEYLIAYGAINSMYDNMVKSGRVYDFDAHTELIKRRAGSFVILWLILGIFSVISICPIFWIVCGIAAVYFVLVFQVFTFEPELSPIGCLKRSFNLIKGNFGKTFRLILLVAIVTYILVPQIAVKLSDISGCTNFLSNIILPVINSLPSIDLSGFGVVLSNRDIAVFTIETTIAQILIQYSLPLRSIACSAWYKELAGKPKETSSSRKSKKRPSEKLMEASHKKFTSKKLDRNILRRAMEKDEE